MNRRVAVCSDSNAYNGQTWASLSLTDVMRLFPWNRLRPDMNRSRTTKRILMGPLTIATSLVLAWGTAALAQENAAKQNAIAADVQQKRVFSGPQPGEQIRPFKVLRFQGEDAKETEIVKKTETGATLICFIHKLSTDDRVLYGLGLVDFYAVRHKDLTSHIVLLTDDREKMLKLVKGWSRGPFFSKSFVSVSVDGAEGPGAYGLNRNVAMTVVVAKGNQVVDNLVFQAPNGRDLGTIMASVAKSLGKPKPDLAKVQKELRAERQRQADKRLKGSKVFKLAPNEQLGRIMYGLVHARGNRVKNADRRSQQLREWVGDSEERELTLRKYCKAVLAGEFSPDRYARAAIEKLAAD